MFLLSQLQWELCDRPPLFWFNWREVLLQLVAQPGYSYGLLLIALLLCSLRPWARRLRPALLGLGVFLLLVYSPVGTNMLTDLLNQLVPTARVQPAQAIVLVGRGPEIAATTTQTAAELFNAGYADTVYVSGDSPSTGQRLLDLGLPVNGVAGDTCARTTWENATYTAQKLQPKGVKRIILITDRWQLPRATAAFHKQGFQVSSVASQPKLGDRQQNYLAIRETLATLSYWILGRGV